MVQEVMMHRREETVDPYEVMANVYGELAAHKGLLVESAAARTKRAAQ